MPGSLLQEPGMHPRSAARDTTVAFKTNLTDRLAFPAGHPVECCRLTFRIRTLVVALPLKTEPCTRLLTYWDALRGDRLLPGRAEIDPAALVAVLPWVSIVELRDPNTMIYRLSGTALRDIMGIEATGRNMLDLVPATSRRQPCFSQYFTSCGRTWT